MGDEVRRRCGCTDGVSVLARHSGIAPRPPARPRPCWAAERRASASRLAPSDRVNRNPASALARPRAARCPARPFTSWLQEHVWVLPNVCAPDAALSVPARPASSFSWGLGITGLGSRARARGLRARVPQWPRPPGFRPVVGAALPPGESPAQASGAAALTAPPGALPVRGYREGLAAFQNLPTSPLADPPTPPRAPCCWESRWRPRAGCPDHCVTQRRALGDSFRSNGPGCGEAGRSRGPGQQGRKWTAAFPAPRATRILLEPRPGRFWGKLG